MIVRIESSVVKTFYIKLLDTESWTPKLVFNDKNRILIA